MKCWRIRPQNWILMPIYLIKWFLNPSPTNELSLIQQKIKSRKRSRKNEGFFIKAWSCGRYICRILCHFTLKRISVSLNIDVFSMHLSSDKGKMIAKNPSQEIGLMVSACQSLVWNWLLIITLKVEHGEECHSTLNTHSLTSVTYLLVKCVISY